MQKAPYYLGGNTKKGGLNSVLKCLFHTLNYLITPLAFFVNKKKARG